MKAPALKCFPTREAKGAPLRPVVQSTEMGVSDLMEVLSPKLDLMSSVPGSNAWEAASASAFPFPGSSKQSSESLPSGPIPSAQATAAKNLYSRPLVGSTSRFQAEPKQSIYPNQLAIKYQPRIPLSLHLNRRFKYLSKIYRFSQLAACRIGKR